MTAVRAAGAAKNAIGSVPMVHLEQPPPPPVRVIASRVEGVSHLRRQEGCQDRWASARCEAGYVVAVADGLGSAPLSSLGAAVATSAAVTEGVRNHEAGVGLPRVAESMVAAARGALEDIAGYMGVPLQDLACTLIATPVRRGAVAVSHIGDGAVVGRSGRGLVLLSGPGESEYVDVVDPLTACNWRQSMRTTPLRRTFSDIAVFTDGVQHAALAPGNTPHRAFLDPLFDFARGVESVPAGCREIEALLSSPRLGEHSDDDKTLVVLTIG